MKINRWIASAVAAVLVAAIARTAHSGTEPIAEGPAVFSLRSYNLTVTGEAASSMLYRITGPEGYGGLNIPEGAAEKDEYNQPVSGLFAAHAGNATCYYKKGGDGKPQNLRCVAALKLAGN